MAIRLVPSLRLGLLAAASFAIPCAESANTPSPATARANPWETTHRYIVQSASAQSALRRVLSVGGESSQELTLIRAVAASLDESQVQKLREMSDVQVFDDRAVSTHGAKTTSPPTALPTSPKSNKSLSTVFTDGTAVTGNAKRVVTNYPFLVDAEVAQSSGITGKGVTIAVLDTGLWTGGNDNFKPRVLASVDMVSGGTQPVTSDPYGHGTHISSIAAGGAVSQLGTYFGIAPQANLVIVRAFDGQGEGSYVNVIAGLNWIVANRQKYNIRVLNLSFGAAPQSYYWNDPLNQAVMAAWQAGIVVVVSAGNEGPQPMTIGVPGNVPYVITTGAMTDNFTPYNPTDDRLASFSSTGPTFEGFVKPEIVSPGGHMVGSMWYQSYLANIDPGSMTPTESLFTMSGTSQAAAVTSGVVALMLQANPSLTPDTVKCRLVATAQPAVAASGVLAYSVFQQGAGLIDAQAAIESTATGCANQGLNIAADLAGTQHFGGPANQDANGNYYIMDMAASTWGAALSGDGYTWTKGYTWSQGYTWTKGYTWSQGYTWTKSYPWSQNAAWSQGNTWSDGYTWTRSVPWWGTTTPVSSAAAPASIEDWVPNE
jgi:serine protease AprX